MYRDHSTSSAFRSVQHEMPLGSLSASGLVQFLPWVSGCAPNTVSYPGEPGGCRGSTTKTSWLPGVKWVGQKTSSCLGGLTFASRKVADFPPGTLVRAPLSDLVFVGLDFEVRCLVVLPWVGDPPRTLGDRYGRGLQVGGLGEGGSRGGSRVGGSLINNRGGPEI